MINNNETPFEDIYSRYLQVKENFEKYEKRLNSYTLNLQDLEKLLKEQLEEKEYKIFFEYNSNNKSLKRIANELNYSYPYVRNLYITSKNKVGIIANVLISQKKTNI